MTLPAEERSPPQHEKTSRCGVAILLQTCHDATDMPAETRPAVGSRNAMGPVTPKRMFRTVSHSLFGPPSSRRTPG